MGDAKMNASVYAMLGGLRSQLADMQRAVEHAIAKLEGDHSVDANKMVGGAGGKRVRLVVPAHIELTLADLESVLRGRGWVKVERSETWAEWQSPDRVWTLNVPLRESFSDFDVRMQDTFDVLGRALGERFVADMLKGFGAEPAAPPEPGCTCLDGGPDWGPCAYCRERDPHDGHIRGCGIRAGFACSITCRPR